MPSAGSLRTPFLVIAVIAALLVVGVEGGSFLGVEISAPPTAGLLDALDQARQMDDDIDLSASDLRAIFNENPPPPGIGISYLALLDGLVLFTLLLMAAALLLPQRVHGRLQGILTLVVAFFTLLGALALAFLALGKVVVMLSLLLAPPFGTLAYMAIYGFFNRGGAATFLSLSMSLKLVMAVLLVLAHQRFLQNKGLVLLLVTSLVGALITGFLHGFVPLFLVSITDAVAAIINAILAMLWALFLLVGAVVSLLKILRLDRAS